MNDEEDDYEDGTQSVMLTQPILGWDPYILVTMDAAGGNMTLNMSLGHSPDKQVARSLFRQTKRGIRMAEKQMMARFKAEAATK